MISDIWAILLPIGGCMLVISILLLISSTSLNRSELKFGLMFLLPFTIYLLLVISVRHFDLESRGNFLSILVLFAILIQFIILNTQITLSDDIYRFILEGKMIINGLNPYATSLNEVPGDFQSQFLPLVNNSHITSPYPPLALILFAILAWINEDPLIFRIVFSLSFIISIVLLDKLLIGKNKWKTIIFAWNPLFHLEVGNGSHFESVIVLILLVGLLFLEKGNSVGGSFAFLGAIFLKYYAIFLIPLFWKHLRKEGQSIILIGILSYLFLVFIDPVLVTGLFIFAEAWYFNASIIWLLIEVTTSFLIAKQIAASIFLLILLVLSKKAQERDVIPYRYAGLVIGSFLLLQPTFHPWYLLWLFPFILMDEEITPWSWIILSGLIIFSYTVYIQYDANNVWYESVSIRLLQYIPFYSLFFLDFRKLFSSSAVKAIHFFKKNREVKSS